jgi:hypothetical protein
MHDTRHATLQRANGGSAALQLPQYSRPLVSAFVSREQWLRQQGARKHNQDGVNRQAPESARRAARESTNGQTV